MEVPLQVEEDEEGIFRDVLDRPMIMVYNSAKKQSKSKKTCPTPQVIRPPLMFVQVDGSKKDNRLERTKMRTHVMRNHFRQKKEKKTALQKHFPKVKAPKESIQASAVASNDHIEICAFSSQPTGGLDSFARAGYPIEMESRSLFLAHHCKRSSSLLSFTY